MCGWHKPVLPGGNEISRGKRTITDLGGDEGGVWARLALILGVVVAGGGLR